MRLIVGLSLFVVAPLAAGFVWPVWLTAYLYILAAAGALIVMAALMLTVEFVFGFSPAQLMEQERRMREEARRRR